MARRNGGAFEPLGQPCRATAPARGATSTYRSGRRMRLRRNQGAGSRTGPEWTDLARGTVTGQPFRVPERRSRGHERRTPGGALLPSVRFSRTSTAELRPRPAMDPPAGRSRSPRWHDVELDLHGTRDDGANATEGASSVVGAGNDADYIGRTWREGLGVQDIPLPGASPTLALEGGSRRRSRRAQPRW